jgi:hypothetical protein
LDNHNPTHHDPRYKIGKPTNIIRYMLRKPDIGTRPLNPAAIAPILMPILMHITFTDDHNPAHRNPRNKIRKPTNTTGHMLRIPSIGTRLLEQATIPPIPMHMLLMNNNNRKVQSI